MKMYFWKISSRSLIFFSNKAYDNVERCSQLGWTFVHNIGILVAVELWNIWQQKKKSHMDMFKFIFSLWSKYMQELHLKITFL